MSNFDNGDASTGGGGGAGGVGVAGGVVEEYNSKGLMFQ